MYFYSLVLSSKHTMGGQKSTAVTDGLIHAENAEAAWKQLAVKKQLLVDNAIKAHFSAFSGSDVNNVHCIAFNQV